MNADLQNVFRHFEELGGIVEGIEIQERNGLRGLFIRGAPRIVKLLVPKRLLIPVDKVRLADGTLTIAKDANVDDSIREFFELYHSVTSWTDGGQIGSRQFLESVAELPSHAKDCLRSGVGLESWFDPLTEEKVLENFIRERSISIGGKLHIAPVLELANYSATGPDIVATEGGYLVQGCYNDEVTWRYAPLDSFQMFATFHFASEERFAYSLPFSISHQAAGLSIKIGNQGSKNWNGGVPYPTVTRIGRQLNIGFLLLGDRKNRDIAFRVFKKTIAPHIGANAEEMFVSLLNQNRDEFLRLSKSCEGLDSKIAATIRNVCRMQLEALQIPNFR